MLISFKYNYLFVHVPKTAGTSIKMALEGTYDEPLSGQLARHTTLKEVYNLLPAKKLDPLYKFAFVRNPWDWVVSTYFYIIENERGEDACILKRKTFAEYVRWLSKCGIKRETISLGWCKRPDGKISKAQIKLRKNLTHKNGRFRHQLRYIHRHHKIGVDFVGHYESLGKDFQSVVEHLNLSHLVRPLPVANKSNHKSYQQYYNKNTQESVNKIYSEDIKEFNYTF